MKTLVWIAGSFFVIFFGFIIGIFLAPLLAYLTGIPVFVIPAIITGLSLIVFIVQHFSYKKAQRATQKSSFYYPGLLVPIFLCSGLLAIHSGVKFEDKTYDSHGIIRQHETYYNSLGIKLFESYTLHFYAYDEYGDAFICCYTYDNEEYDTREYSNMEVTYYRRPVQYKIYTSDGTLAKSGDKNYYYKKYDPSSGSTYYEYKDSRYDLYFHLNNNDIDKDMIKDIAKSMNLIPE